MIAIEAGPTNLDPRISTDHAGSRVFDVLLSGLATKTPQGDLVPDLAESWEVLDAGRRWRFRLRPGVTFHDGRPLSSADVVWTFQTILDGTVATTKRAAFATVERVEAVDPLTVDFVLVEPFGALISELTSGQGIIPAGTTSEQMNARPVGSGPFRLVERGPDRLVFVPFAGYRDGPPRLSRLVLKVVPDATVRALELMKGSVQLVINDLSPDVIPFFRADPRYEVVQDPGATYSYLGFNFADPLLADPRVRRAIVHAIDRERLVRTLWRGLGTVTETMLQPGHWARHEGLPPIPYDVTAAKRLLDEAGWPDPDGDGPAPRFELSYKTSTNEPYVLQAQVIQAMLAEAGIAVRVQSFEFATFYEDVRKGNFQVFAMLRTGVVDPHIYRLVLHSASVPPAGQNRGRYENARFDELVDRGASLVDQAERRVPYLEAQEILARDLPYASLYIRHNVAVMAAGLEGYRNYPSGELYGLKDMYWAR